ncbi:MAG: phage resistance protein, partial [Aeromicrobium sp.]|nr:phage resistance protein [Aeromicrobium sp.]
LADGILADAQVKRSDLGDEMFFRLISEGESTDEWGDYGSGWDAPRFEGALLAPAGSGERDALISALFRSLYSAFPGQANATADGFVPLDDGLEAISRHAKSLGYDAVVLFLDELVLWLASRASDLDFLSREGAKIVKLVEGDDAKRPVPIVSLIARQRDLRELVGDQVPGVQAASATHVLRFSEGRFDTITLEDRNLPAIASQRLLRPKSVQAEQQLDAEFAKLRRQLDERGERDVLLTDTGDIDAFRRLYPFSPALVDALVALSGAMQRERTALKVMLQLLVDNRDRLEVGQLVPLGDLFDAINAGDEPLTEVMRAQFAQARRLWSQRFEPLLLRNHDLRAKDIDELPVTHQFITESRLVKSLLIAALVPEVGPLRAMTVSRLTALNSGIVRAFIPGSERQQVLETLRRWASEVGELRLGDDENDPTVSVVLQGIDTGPILDAAKTVDNLGERRRRVKELLGELLTVKGLDTFDPWLEVEWRGFTRRVDLTFANVRDSAELPDESLRSGANPKLIIDYPWDDTYGPADDRARILDYRTARDPEWTAVWLPNFLSGQSSQLLGKLVMLDYVLTGDTFDRLAGHLSSTDRPLARSQLTNERAAVRERVMAILRQAYGVDHAQPGTVDPQLTASEHLLAVDAGLTLRPPAGPSLRAWAEGVTHQMYEHRYPKHPLFTDKVTVGDLRNTLAQVTLALAQPGGRLENVDTPLRKVLTRVADPLKLGAMYSAHFIADVQDWTDLIERRRTEAGASVITVRQCRAWLDGAATPSERRGLITETADLVILAFAAATDRSLMDAGRVVGKPEIGKLRDEWELRAQDLPSDTHWTTALARAKHMGVVPVSELRSATAVADLSDRIVRELVADRADVVRALVPALRSLAAIAPLADTAPRMATALAAHRLVDQIAAHPDRVIEALATLDIPTTAAELGTSIKQASAVGAEIAGFNLALVRQAIGLGGDFAGDASRLGARLVEAATVDQLTESLIDALRAAVRSATDLLGRAAAAATAGAAVTTSVVQEGETVDQRRARVRAQAEHELGRIRERLSADAQLSLSWTIEELDHGDD